MNNISKKRKGISLVLKIIVILAAIIGTILSVAIVMSSKWKLGKFKYVRICTDLVCVALGCILFVMAGNAIGKIPTIAGVGTIITAFFMGPLIDFFNEKFAKPLLSSQ